MGDKVVVIQDDNSTDVDAVKDDVAETKEELEQIEEQLAETAETAIKAETLSEENNSWLERLSETMAQISMTLRDNLEGLNNRLTEMEAKLSTPQPSQETVTEMLEMETTLPETLAETSSETKTEALDESVEESPVAETVQELDNLPRQIIKL